MGNYPMGDYPMPGYRMGDYPMDDCSMGGYLVGFSYGRLFDEGLLPWPHCESGLGLNPASTVPDGVTHVGDLEISIYKRPFRLIIPATLTRHDVTYRNG